MNFVEEAMTEDQTLRSMALSGIIKARFDTSVHPRSIGRALARHKKTARAVATSCGYREFLERYEILRGQVLSRLSGEWGLGILLHKGMAAWM